MEKVFFPDLIASACTFPHMTLFGMPWYGGRELEATYFYSHSGNGVNRDMIAETLRSLSWKSPILGENDVRKIMRLGTR